MDGKNRKRRFLALALAAVMMCPASVSDAGDVLIEEAGESVFEGVWTAESEESILEPDVLFLSDAEEAAESEAIALEDTWELAGAEEEEELIAEESMTEPVSDETGEEELVEAADEFDEVVWEVFEAEQSGNASDASGQKASVLPGYSSYGAQLTGESRKIYDAVVSAWATKGGTETIVYTLSSPYRIKTNAKAVNGELKWDADKDTAYQKAYNTALNTLEYQVQSALDAFRYDHPEVFWLGNIKWWSTGGREVNSKGIYMTISTVVLYGYELYSGAKSETAAFGQAVNGVVSRIRAGLPSGADRYDTVLAIHDYICDTVTYEENAYAHTAAGVFLHGQKVVCEGYAKAFKILCGRFGIPCTLVVGDAKGYEEDTGGPHMWNYVKMEDGVWYLVDTTWDDLDGLVNPEEMGLEPNPYFLAGSSSNGYWIPVSRERSVTGTFSTSDNTKNFGVPALSTTKYVHHIWKQISRREPTCTQAGSRELRCTLHGETRTEALPAGHIFTSYVSNQDATCLKDGTKTAVCDRCRSARNTVADAGSKLKAYAKFTASSVTLQKKQSTSGLKVTAMQKGDSVVSWKSSNKKIVTVSGKANGTCKLTAKNKTGTAKITLKFKSGLKKTVKVKVQNDKVKTKSITGVAKNLTLKKGRSYTLKPARKPFTSKEKITYSTSNQKVAKVSPKGVIKAVSPGKARITVSSGGRKVVCTVKVTAS